MNRRILFVVLAVAALLAVIEPRITADTCGGTGDQGGPFCIDGVIPDATVATTTTLTAAVNNSITTFAVASTTGFVANDYALVDQEKVLVKSVTDATSMIVVRAQLGSTAVGHALDARITDLKPINNDPSFGSDELGPKNGNNTKLNVINEKCTPGTTSKTCLESTNPNGGNDLDTVWLKGQTGPGPGGATDDLWIYFGWSRNAASGTGLIGVELHRLPADAACDYVNKTEQQLKETCNPFKSRRDGDILLLWDQQGGSRDVYIREFIENAGANPDHAGVWGLPISLTIENGPYEGTAFAQYGNGGFRGEMAVDLSKVLPPSGEECDTFANVVPGTITGNSDTADYKDIVLKKFPLISNCGGLKIVKNTVPDGGTGTFNYLLSGVTGMFPGDVDSDCTDENNHNQCAGTLVNDDDDDEIEALFNSGNYTLSEGTIPSNYQLTSISCVLGENTYDVFPGVDPNNPNKTFPVQTGGQTVCTITNTLKTGTLRVKKEITNDFGVTANCTQFQFKLDSGSFQAWDNTCQTDFVLNVGTVHNVVEDLTSIPLNFAFDSYSADCTDVTIVADTIKTCTVKNKAVKGSPALVTGQKIILHDRAHITGIRRGANDDITQAKASSVAFTLYNGSGCSGTVVGTQTVSLDFPNATDTAITVGTSTGFPIEFNTGTDNGVRNWSWKVIYSGNLYNLPTPEASSCNEAISVTISGNGVIPQ